MQSPSHEEGLLSENGSRRKFFKSLHHPVGLDCVDLVGELRSVVSTNILESKSFGQNIANAKGTTDPGVDCFDQ